MTTPLRGDAMFQGVDRALFASALAAQLRRAGLPVAFTATERFVRALGAVPAPAQRDLYWVARISFVHDRRHLDRFDAVFDAVFETRMGRVPGEQRGPQPLASRADDTLAPVRRTSSQEAATISTLPWATLPSAATDVDDANDDTDDGDVALPERRPSLTASDADRPFDLLDDDVLRRVGDMLESSIRQWPRRRSRRRRNSHTGGRIALRRSLQRAMRTGGDVIDFVETTPRMTARRVVVLLDVSGSMESYARAYLHLARPLAQRRHAEVFAFSTELTRITPAVRTRSPADAIDQLGDAVGDRFSGTRLAASLGALMTHRTWSSLVRGSVVVIFSDGWDSGSADEMDRQMQRLALRAHRVVWVNPRSAASGFEPLVAGMAAALPHCDAFLAGNTARSLETVVAALADDQGKPIRSRTPSPVGVADATSGS